MAISLQIARFLNIKGSLKPNLPISRTAPLSNFKFVRKFRLVALNAKSHKNVHNKVFSSNYTIVSYNQPFKTVLTVEMSMLHLTPYPDRDVRNTSHCVLKPFMIGYNINIIFVINKF